MKFMSKVWATTNGFSEDKRKRRRQHRKSAKQLLQEGGSICTSVAIWHLYQARYWKR